MGFGASKEAFDPRGHALGSQIELPFPPDLGLCVLDRRSPRLAAKLIWCDMGGNLCHVRSFLTVAGQAGSCAATRGSAV